MLYLTERCYVRLLLLLPLEASPCTQRQQQQDEERFATVVVAVAAAVVVVVVFIVAGCRCAFVSFVRYLMQTNYANRGCIAAARLGLSLEFEVRVKVT